MNAVCRAACLIALGLLLAVAPLPLHAQGDDSLLTWGITLPATPAQEQTQIIRAEARIAQAGGDDLTAWVAAQVALGDGLAARGTRLRDPDILENAAGAYVLALSARARAPAPRDWARVEAMLGRVLRIAAQRSDRLGAMRLGGAAAETLRQAIAATSRDTAPLAWASMQAELGQALMEMALSGPGTEELEGAVAAHRLALMARGAAGARRERAASQMQLGLALAELGERTSDPAPLTEGVESYEAGLAFLAPFWPHSERTRAREQRDRIRRDLDRIRRAL